MRRISFCPQRVTPHQGCNIECRGTRKRDPGKRVTLLINVQNHSVEQCFTFREAVDKFSRIERQGGSLAVLIILQADDSMAIENIEFLEQETNAPRRYTSKQREHITL